MKGRKFIILGDSTLKHLNDWEMLKKLNGELQNFRQVFLKCNCKLHGRSHKTIFAKRPE